MQASIGVCPRCQVTLTAIPDQGRRPQMCGVCRGIFFSWRDLKQLSSGACDAVQRGVNARVTEALKCPVDQTSMTRLELAEEGRTIALDQCPGCRGVWFDGGEIRQVRRLARRVAVSRRSRAVESQRGAHGRTYASPIRTRKSREAKVDEQVALELARVKARQEWEGEQSTSLGQWAFAFFTQLPLEGFNPVYRFPVVTWSLLFLCVLVFFVDLPLSFETLMAYGLSVEGLGERPIYGGRFVSHLFLHASWLHLLANMYFLKVFGDNVEDRLGRLPFLLFYLLCGVLAAATELMFSTGPLVMLGASGAIGGILGAYLVFFADMPIRIPIFWWVVPVRAFFVLPLWLLWDVVLWQMGVSGIAFLAHIGGFLAGFGLAWCVRAWLKDPRVALIRKQMKAGTFEAPE